MALRSNQQLLELLLVTLLIAATKAEPMMMSKPNCSSKCGSVSIPFPFGITKECSLNPSFIIICNQTSQTPFLKNNKSVPLLNISLIKGELHISLPVARSCCKNSTCESVNETNWEFDLTPFQLSSKRNKLTGVGIDTALLVVPSSTNTSERRNNNSTESICLSALRGFGELKNGSCSGVGCCQVSISQGLSNFYYDSQTNYLINNDNYMNLLETYPCGYAFLVEDGTYNFSSTHLPNFPKTEFPVVLNWAVGNHTCREAQKNASTYACKSHNSVCGNSEVGLGYLCYCSHGYRGNPYLVDGCQDIDECKETNDCVSRANCKNLLGSYNCSCMDGYEGDGTKKRDGCKPKPKKDSKRDIILKITLSVSVGILALLGGSFCVYWALKKRRLIKLKEQFFQQNGGLLLQQQIAKHRGSTEIIKVFTVEELKQATNNFDKDRVLGQGGQGTVYKGELVDNRTVAIKKSKISEIKQIEQFINEVIILSQINHRNVVKLVGCCLETEVPVLVYEFISNGTLYEHLHGQSCSVKLTWETRLRIATEIAGALAYLHYAASEPIIHRDVKTTNILLDHNLTAKVSDFGASRIVPLDHTQITTLVQGTLGYLDPEYLHTSQLTEKSDVYSFGVVLAELLTGKKALSFHKEESVKSLALYFVYSMIEGQLLDIVDSRIIDEASVGQLMKFANIAKRCLKVKGEERPPMKEVAMELEGINVAEMHQQESVNLSSKEIESSGKTKFYAFSVENDPGGSSGTNSGFDSLNQISTSLDDGR